MKKIIYTLIFSAVTVQLFSQARSISSNAVIIIDFSPSGNVWASEEGAGCSVYNPATCSVTDFNTTNSPMLSDSITAITLYGINGVPTAFMGTTNGVFYRQGTTWSNLPALVNSYVTGMTKSPDNRLYVSTPAGISVFKADSLYHIADLTTGNSNIPFYDVSALQAKNITACNGCTGFYAATPDSGYFYTIDAINFFKVNTRNSNLLNDTINLILISKTGAAHYIATKGGLSVDTSGPSSSVPDTANAFVNYTVAQGLPENDVTAIDVDSTGRIWVGTRNSGIAIYTGNHLDTLLQTPNIPSNKITSINCNSTCKCWTGSQDSGIVVIDSVFSVYTVAETCVPTAVTDVTASLDIKVFPQPAQDIVQFELGSPVANAEVLLYDFNGRLVLKTVERNAQFFSLNVNNLASGFYFYTLKDAGEQAVTGKISIIH